LRAGAGLNLQKANCVVFGELDWSPAVHSQCEDRAHRIGQDDSVLCYYLVAEEGTDETIQEFLGLKVSQFVGIMGDKAETEEDKMLAQAKATEHMNKIVEKLKGGKQG
jgi:SNF2 family DNA or RNA helicase